MTNKPKAIGTHAESAVLKILKPHFPDADRGALTGSQDQGDIRHCGDFIFEVKGGKQTNQIGTQTLNEWMEQARVEAEHAGKTWGVLVTQRAGFGAPRAQYWWAYITMQQLALWTGGHYIGTAAFVPVRVELWALLELLADHGYTLEGAPLAQAV